MLHYCCSLPKSVQRRIKALKKLQFETTKIEAEFYEEIHKLECKFAERYTPVFKKVCQGQRTKRGGQFVYVYGEKSNDPPPLLQKHACICQ